MNAAPWRGARGEIHAGVPAWGAPRGGPAEVSVDLWPEEITPEWAFGDTRGAGVRVCVLDSGVDADHPQVGPVEVSMGVAVDPGGRARVVSVDAVDTAGHGTACAGVIRSLAPKCALTSVRVLTAGVQGGGAALLAGLRWAIDEEYDVINLSVSTSKATLRLGLAELCDEAYFKRSIICASAHNLPVESYPWRFAAVVSVASHQERHLRGHYYNLLPPVEFFAPGVGVKVPWAGRTTLRASGNSFATPYMSGLCALALSAHPGLTPFQLKTLLYLTAGNVGVHRDRTS